MADSLVLTGSRQVTKQTGTEMVRKDAKRGGNTWQLPRWWAKTSGVIYVDCTVFEVTAGGESGYLAVESNPSVNLKITHDGSFNFTFSGINEASRAALFDENMELVEHYVFPRISGGKVMTVVPADGADRPGAGGPPPPPPSTSIGTVTVSGSANVANGTTGETYSVDTSNATASDLTYAWTVQGDGVISGDADGASVDVDFTYNTGTSIVSVIVSSDAADFDGNDEPDSQTVTVSA